MHQKRFEASFGGVGLGPSTLEHNSQLNTNIFLFLYNFCFLQVMSRLQVNTKTFLFSSLLFSSGNGRYSRGCSDTRGFLSHGVHITCPSFDASRSTVLHHRGRGRVNIDGYPTYLFPVGRCRYSRYIIIGTDRKWNGRW